MKEFIISETLANQILGYLIEQKWREVEQLIHGLQGLREFKKEEENKPDG